MCQECEYYKKVKELYESAYNRLVGDLYKLKNKCECKKINESVLDLQYNIEKIDLSVKEQVMAREHEWKLIVEAVKSVQSKAVEIKEELPPEPQEQQYKRIRQIKYEGMQIGAMVVLRDFHNSTLECKCMVCGKIVIVDKRQFRQGNRRTCGSPDCIKIRLSNRCITKKD